MSEHLSTPQSAPNPSMHLIGNAIEQDNIHVQLQDIIAVTKELTAVLAAEVSLLKAMKVRDIEPLQKDKLRLSQQLEAMKQFILQHPEVIRQTDAADMQRYQHVADDFEKIMLENHRYLLMTRQVNAKIIGAIKAAVKEQHSPVPYNAAGRDNSLEALHLRLNEVI